MKLARLEAVLHARPFRPFEVRVDGEAIRVMHPDQVLFVDNKATAIIEAADRMHIVDVAVINKLDQLRRRSAHSRT